MDNQTPKGCSPFASLVISIIFGALIFTGVSYLRKNYTIKKIGPSQPVENNKVITPKTNTGPSGKENPNNGTKDVTITDVCKDESCFENKFESCMPAMFSARSNSESIRFEILNKEAGGCSVSMTYTASSNPQLVSQEMTCILNNSQSFQKAVEEAFTNVINGELTCTGPLYDLLKSR